MKIDDIDLSEFSIVELNRLSDSVKAEINERKGYVERGRPLTRIPDEWELVAIDEEWDNYELYRTPLGYTMIDTSYSTLDVAASGNEITNGVDWSNVCEIVEEHSGVFSVRIGNRWEKIKFETPGGTPLGSIRSATQG